MEITGQSYMGFLLALMSNQDNNYSQESLGVVVEAMNKCLDPFDYGSDEGM